MKITELKDWNLLSPEEQDRLREVYQVDENDELPITKTMAEKPPEDKLTPEQVAEENKKTEGGDNA